MIFMSRRLVVLGIASIVCVCAIVVGVQHRPHAATVSCIPVLPIPQSKTEIDRLDGSTGQFASTTTIISDRSTEGGVQYTYTSNGTRQITEQRFYGETGRSYMRFYYVNKAIFALVKLDIRYKVPISVDDTGAVASSEERDYYLDVNGRVCNWVLNGKEQSVTSETIDMVNEYVSEISN